MSKRGRAILILWTVICLAFACTAPAAVAREALAPWSASQGVLIEGATVVTMDARHDVLPFGSVLVRDGKIVAVWTGPKPPSGVMVGEYRMVDPDGRSFNVSIPAFSLDSPDGKRILN